MTWNRGVRFLLVALAALAGAATASAKEIDTLYAQVLREPANTELNLRFARLAEDQDRKSVV